MQKTKKSKKRYELLKQSLFRNMENSLGMFVKSEVSIAKTALEVGFY
jgi:hypothetical protein